MKNILLSAFMLAGALIQIHAATVEFDFTSGYENTEFVIEDIEKDGVTIKMSSNGNSNGPKWYSQGTAVRLYGGNIIKITANENIRSVTFTFSEEKYRFGNGTSAPKVTPGTYSQEGTTGIWEVGSSSGTLRVGGVDAHARVQKITVVTGTAEMETTPSPVISPENETIFGEEGLEVSISAAGAAKIHYTTDGSEPTKESALYTTPFRITESTTVKAFATEEGKNDSPAVSATYIKEVSGVDTISQDNPEVRINGCIIEAPAGAALYSLSGERMGDSPLPAGLYIVRLPNGKAVKVMID